MNWEAIGAISELAGSAAVLITIAYLAVQIRQSTKQAKSNAAQRLRTEGNDLLRGISDNTDVVKTYTLGLKTPEKLDLNERVRFDLVVLQLLRTTEGQFLQYCDGYLSEELWESTTRQTLFILKTKGGRQSWERQKNLLGQRFRDYMDERLDAT